MKKIFFALVALLSIIFVSCSTSNKKEVIIETEEVCQIPMDSISTMESKNFYVIQNGDSPARVAGKTLRNENRFGEILVKTPEVTNTLAYRAFNYKEKDGKFGLGIKVYVGDTLWLPNDAINCGKKMVPRSLPVIFGDITSYRKTVQKNVPIPITPNENNFISNNNLDLFGHILSWLLFLLIALFLAASIWWVLRKLFPRRDTTSITSVTESENENPQPLRHQDININVTCVCGKDCSGNCNECLKSSSSTQPDWFGMSMFMNSMGDIVPNGTLENTVWHNGQPVMSTKIDNSGSLRAGHVEAYLKGRLDDEFKETDTDGFVDGLMSEYGKSIKPFSSEEDLERFTRKLVIQARRESKN